MFATSSGVAILPNGRSFVSSVRTNPGATAFVRIDKPAAEPAADENPGATAVRHAYALFLAAMARFSEALAQMSVACELDPLSLVEQAKVETIQQRMGFREENLRRSITNPNDKPPAGAKAPDAMLSISSAQDAMNDRKGAQKTLEDLVAKYPTSGAAASAKQRLAVITKR